MIGGKQLQMKCIKMAFTDDDLYNFSMAWAYQKWPDILVRYRYKNRMKDFRFSPGIDKVVAKQCEMCEELTLSAQEEDFLSTMKWYPRTFLNSLRGTRFNHKAVSVWMKDDMLNIEITGYPYEVVFWECTLLPIITQLVNMNWVTGQMNEMAPDWKDRIRRKADELAAAKVNWIDFGTRRRYSTEVHNSVVEIMKDYAPYFRGTSNVYLAMLHNIRAAGTYAHQYEQFMQAIYGPRMASLKAMEHWVTTYHGNLGTALSDTLTTDYFLRVFDTYFANLFQGVRQDSGDPFVFADKMIDHYKKLGIDPMTKVIVFSDSLDVNKAIRLNKYCKDFIRCTMGIGTHLTADVGYQPMNHVIKMTDVFFQNEWIPVVKLSDDKGKHIGDEETIQHVMRELRINTLT